ncbi:hypothetical protein [Streptomyces chryseus]|uniref:hypothetical protein n=1 Tax=Streptomyces chryseus TaxID=68186 RepID=UPI00110F96B8|nr:hypothetical protein [Streptomyces chryseus]GGW99827.1 hypothetical protein GCM10010353_14390 [Streptomyces chryseus]
MSAAPGADELRVRGILLRRGLGLNDMPPAPHPADEDDKPEALRLEDDVDQDQPAGSLLIALLNWGAW